MAAKEQNNTMSDAALARKRRMAMRNKQRSTPSVSPSSEDEASNGARESKRARVMLEAEVQPMVVSSSVVMTKSSSHEDIMESVRKKKPHITGIKRQSRYDPGVPMTKEELKAWRKEARRVRNRESAAMSRKKNRDDLDKLGTKVKEIETKYDAALRYILDLEDKLRRSGTSSSLFPSPSLRQDLEDARNSSWPLQVKNDLNKNSLNKNSPYQSFSSCHPSHHQTLNSQKHIIDNTIIRPIACV